MRSVGLEAALTRAVTTWSRLALGDFINGVVIFCSSEFTEVMQPPRPLNRQSYACGPHFDTSTIDDALAIRRRLTYGVIVVDGDEATVGVAQARDLVAQTGVAVTQLAHLSSNIASRTRRGGQSAARYGRNRDGEELAFLRKVAEQAHKLLGDLRGLIVGGRADMKRKLLSELPLSLRGRVVRLVDLACGAGSEGLHAAAAHHTEVLERDLQQETADSVSRFLELASRTEAHAASLVCYGESQTAAAVRLGAVHQLLVAKEVLQHGSRRWQDWHALATAFGASIVEVDMKTEAELRFCEGFGVGACLRYAIDPDLLEEVPADDLDDEAPSAAEEELQKPPPSPPLVAMTEESDCETASTATSRSGAVLLRWLEAALKHSLGDDTAAESLTMCVDVVLFDGTTPINEESLDSAVEMLRGEAVSEEVLVEFACHAADLIAETQ